MEYKILKARGRISRNIFNYSKIHNSLLQEDNVFNSVTTEKIIQFLDDPISGWDILEIELKNGYILTKNTKVNTIYVHKSFYNLDSFQLSSDNKLVGILSTEIRGSNIKRCTFSVLIDNIIPTKEESIITIPTSNYTIEEIKQILIKSLDEDVLDEVIKDLIDYKNNIVKSIGKEETIKEFKNKVLPKF